MNHPVMHTHVLGASFYMHDNWAPSKDEIIIGRGKKVYEHPGNQKLRDLVQNEVTAYSNAKNRAAKSAIIIRIFKVIRADSSVGFVKKDSKTKKYYAVEDAAAKCAIAQCFRDALADLGHRGYKSSKQYKQKTRDAMRRSASDVGPISESMVAKPPMRRSASSDNPSAVAMMPIISRSIFEEVLSEEDEYEPKKESPARFLKQALLESRRKTNSVHGILQDTSDLLAAGNEDFEWPEMVEETNLRAPGNETILAFEKLYKAFGSNVDTSSNPFEPVPLKESSKGLKPDACAFGLSFDDASSHSSKEAVAV